MVLLCVHVLDGLDVLRVPDLPSSNAEARLGRNQQLKQLSALSLEIFYTCFKLPGRGELGIVIHRAGCRGKERQSERDVTGLSIAWGAVVKLCLFLEKLVADRAVSTGTTCGEKPY